MLTIDDVIDRFDGSLAYSTNSKEICQYIAEDTFRINPNVKYAIVKVPIYDNCALFYTAIILIISSSYTTLDDFYQYTVR